MQTEVTITAGALRGVGADGVVSFKGIPYAAPPVGANRFLAPQPVDEWTGVRDAHEYGASCPQPSTRPKGWTLEHAEDEDCLYLNVWTPGADDGRRPVLFWIHGGGYAIGSGSWPLYDGARLARRGDAVVITVNHRLGPFGYLHLAELMGDEVATSGNNGNLDLVAALEWVRDNVSAFGGDPDNVTIFGESGGGAKVSNLLAMPAAAGLFHRAAIQSGPGLTAARPDRATGVARALLDALSLASDDLDGLRAVAADKLVAATPDGNRMAYGPVVDGAVLPTHPVKALLDGSAADVPILIGCNRDEFGTFAEIDDAALAKRAARLAGDAADEAVALYRQLHPDATNGHIATWMATDATMRAGSQALAKARVDGPGVAPVYQYFFTYELGGLAAHGYEIGFVFDNIGRTHASAMREKLAAEMSEAWLAFARTGNPSHDGLGDWPAYDTDRFATMVFQRDGSVVVDDPNRPARELWARLPRRAVTLA